MNLQNDKQTNISQTKKKKHAPFIKL